MTQKGPVEMAETNLAKREQAAQHRVDVTAHLASHMAQATVSGDRGIALRSVPFVGQIGIRAVLNSSSAKALEEALGLTLPAHVGAVSSANGVFVLWMSPDEFLLVTDPENGAVVDTADRVAVLAAALGDLPGSVIDLSANRVVLELSGPSATDLLEKGFAIDLHPTAFPAGSAIQSMFGKVAAFVWKREENKYYVLVRSSFAEHTINWIIDAMQEYAAPKVS